MFRFKTFGGIDLREDGKPPLAEALAQPKRVALLACLAAREGGYVRRDTLLALLWPEQDSDRARHSLRQSLYRWRHWLGNETILNRGEEELAIDPARLWCDAAEFKRLIGEGRTEDALDLYRGDFLPGFHVPDTSEEFEAWLDAARQDYRGAALRAATRLVQEAQAAGELDRALEYARSAASIDPLNESVHVDLVRLLGARGNAAGARRVYLSLAERLERELGTSPSAATRQALETAERAQPSPEPNASGPASAPPSTATRPKTRGPVRRSWFALGGLAVAGMIVAALLINRPAATHLTPVLAVAPIRQIPTGGDSAEVLSIADLLATSLGRLPAMQVLSNARLIEIEQSLARAGAPAAPTEIARRAGATELLEGTLYRRGPDSLVLELRQTDLKSGRVLHGYRVAAVDIFALVDRATVEIARTADVARPARGIADVTTGSLIALRLYQEGLRSYYGADPLAARRLFQAAISEDSSFAMAMWYLARAEQVIPLPEARAHFLAALRLASRASDRERLLITADVKRMDATASSVAVAETLVARYPSDPDAYWMLGVTASGESDYQRAIEALRRTIALDSSLELRPGPACRVCDVYDVLIQSYLWMDSTASARATAEEYARRLPESPRSWSSLTAVAWGTYDSLRATQAETEFFRLVPGARRAGISQIALFQIARGNYESAEERLLSQARGDDQLRGDARWYVMIALRNQGRLREALRVGRGNLPRNDPWWGLDPKPDTLNSALIEYEQGKPASCIGMMEAVPRQPNHRQLAADWPGQAAREESWALARLVMCRASQGDTTGFSAMADTLQKLGSISNFGRDRRLHHYVRGLLWKARGKPEQAVAELQAAISSPTFGFTRINYELGQLLLQLGRPGDAVAILQPALRGALDASNLYLSRTEIHELLAKAWDSAGRADSARAHWAQVERSWRGADPQFHARWEVAKNKVRQSVTR